jgi:hypothetical protein
MRPARRAVGRALTSLAAWLHVRRRQAFTARGRQCTGRRRCTKDDAMRMTTALSHRQVGATRHAGTFLAILRAFLSSGVPERAPGGRGWLGLAGWMKTQIQAKTRNRGRDWAIFRRPDEKKGCRGPRRDHGWRCSQCRLSLSPFGRDLHLDTIDAALLFVHNRY